MLRVVASDPHLLDGGASRVIATVVAHRDLGRVAGSDYPFRETGGRASAVGVHAHYEERFVTGVHKIEVHRLYEVETESAETLRRLGELNARAGGKGCCRRYEECYYRGKLFHLMPVISLRFTISYAQAKASHNSRLRIIPNSQLLFGVLIKDCRSYA